MGKVICFLKGTTKGTMNKKGLKEKILQAFIYMAPPDGLEPPT